MGPRTGLDRCGKSRFPPGFDPRTVKPVASRYTGYVTQPAIILQASIIWTVTVLPLLLTWLSDIPR